MEIQMAAFKILRGRKRDRPHVKQRAVVGGMLSGKQNEISHQITKPTNIRKETRAGAVLLEEKDKAFGGGRVRCNSRSRSESHVGQLGGKE